MVETPYFHDNTKPIQHYFFLRHGEQNNGGAYAPLLPKGIQQVAAQAASIVNIMTKEGINSLYALASPVQRTQETLEHLRECQTISNALKGIENAPILAKALSNMNTEKIDAFTNQYHDLPVQTDAILIVGHQGLTGDYVQHMAKAHDIPLNDDITIYSSFYGTGTYLNLKTKTAQLIPDKKKYIF
jgi:phosphohistidine phosphatase SixA